MTSIASDIVKINNSSGALFNFLGDLNNLEKLMPEQVIKWKSTENDCSFTIKGMADLSLIISQKIPAKRIVINSGINSKIRFEMLLDLTEISNDSTDVRFTINAELNPIMKMMVQTPLLNFLNILVQKLKDIHS
ncbi:MAG: hypothetical protein Q8880_05200 [Bacteroidota bacterium]|nr:hypothetical protein [Bacteroidota bacterium]